MSNFHAMQERHELTYALIQSVSDVHATTPVLTLPVVEHSGVWVETCTSAGSAPAEVANRATTVTAAVAVECLLYLLDMSRVLMAGFWVIVGSCRDWMQR